MNAHATDKRIEELLEVEEAEGRALALPIERVLELEDAGFVVDILTGEFWREAGEALLETTHNERQ